MTCTAPSGLPFIALVSPVFHPLSVGTHTSTLYVTMSNGDPVCTGLSGNRPRPYHELSARRIQVAHRGRRPFTVATQPPPSPGRIIPGLGGSVVDRTRSPRTTSMCRCRARTVSGRGCDLSELLVGRWLPHPGSPGVHHAPGFCLCAPPCRPSSNPARVGLPSTTRPHLAGHSFICGFAATRVY